jgi:hypothetical protein
MPKLMTGPEGVSRLVTEERELNQAFVALFNNERGQRVLDYLRRITIETVGGPEISDQHLRHLEGQRFVVGVIEQRVQNGRDNLP